MAIARIDEPEASPREISSRSRGVSAKSERRRTGGAIPRDATPDSPALIEQIPAMASPTPGGGIRSRVLGETFGSPPDPAFWEKNSPISIARKANLAGLKIYFDCGDRDDHGFEEGAKALDKALKSRHIAHEAHIYAGRHDWQYFAEHLPDSLEFESRAFGK